VERRSDQGLRTTDHVSGSPRIPTRKTNRTHIAHFAQGLPGRHVVAKTLKVLHVAHRHRRCCLDLDSGDRPTVIFDDQIDLSAVAVTPVGNRRLSL